MTIFAPQFVLIGFCRDIRKSCSSTLVGVNKFQKVIYNLRSIPHDGLLIHACITPFGDVHKQCISNNSFPYVKISS